ncbi:MAG TPA: hypothetical protein VGR02_05775 [Thermoanaerobaculia bacterium]|jgi:hypothetical protein|nr:hypothetical protein [Thermoanaerobaculia bacterium]
MNDDGNLVPIWGVIVLGGWLIVATTGCVFVLSQMWPHPTPSGAVPQQVTPGTAAELTPDFLNKRCRQDQQCRQCEELAHVLRAHLRTGDKDNDPECVPVFGRDWVVWNERRLVLIVILCGAIGGFVYALRSYFWYVGNEKLTWSWVPLYLVAPFTSALLAVVMYLVIRGGFFSGASTVSDTSPYAFAALAALVGLFHRETAEKLRQIFEVAFTKAETGKDAAKNPAPVLTEIVTDPKPVPRDRDAQLKLVGSGFVRDSVVELNATPLKSRAVRVSDAELQVTVLKKELEAIKGKAIIAVHNPAPGGGLSDGIELELAPLP